MSELSRICYIFANCILLMVRYIIISLVNQKVYYGNWIFHVKVPAKLIIVLGKPSKKQENTKHFKHDCLSLINFFDEFMQRTRNLTLNKQLIQLLKNPYYSFNLLCTSFLYTICFLNFFAESLLCTYRDGDVAFPGQHFYWPSQAAVRSSSLVFLLFTWNILYWTGLIFGLN